MNKKPVRNDKPSSVFVAPDLPYDVGLGPVVGNCSGCRFFLPGAMAIDPGQCRRFPPSVLFIEVTRELRSVLPAVLATEGCGEFRPVVKP